MSKHLFDCVSSRACLAAIGLALTLGGAGCGTLGGPDAENFASVTIEYHPPEVIAAATVEVFVADGYRVGATGPGQMVFEKTASALTSVSRDGFVATQSGTRTINRARVEIVRVGEHSHRLQCKAYLVSGGSDPFFQNEVALSKARSGSFRLLLNKVAKQLKGE